MALEVSFVLLDNIYSTGITYDRQNLFIEQATGLIFGVMDRSLPAKG